VIEVVWRGGVALELLTESGHFGDLVVKVSVQNEQLT
jgi:hypothetical protein